MNFSRLDSTKSRVWRSRLHAPFGAYGYIATSMTGMIYTNPACITGTYIYNNVFWNTANGCPGNDYITAGITNSFFFNNPS